jgi:hypothetical protein
MAQNKRARTPEEEAAARRELERGYQPKTPLGELLWEARKEFLRSGEPFLREEEDFRTQLDHLQREAREEYLRAGDSPLDWDGLEKEIAERRGGVSEEDTIDAGERPTVPVEDEFQPRTPLGRSLWELRKQIVASGEPLLDRDDLEREVAERRGGVSDDDS